MQESKHYAIIGTPLGHSKSPLLHSAFFEHLKYKGKYELFDLPAEELEDFIKSMPERGLHGLSVTIPHKVAITQFLDDISPLAKSVGAVNTVYIREGELCGDNTDVHGFLMPLRHKKIPHRAFVLGAGGAARAVIVALKTLRAEGMGKIFVSARNAQKAEKLCEEFQCVYVPWEERTSIKAPWLINTTPLGMHGALEDETPFPLKALLNHGGKSSLAPLAYDLVYNPLQTRFLREAQQAGWETQNGLDMFLGQAIAQQKLWLGLAAYALEEEECLIQMRDILIKNLGS